MFIKKFLESYIYPVATLSGAIIGVGFFSLPYITMKVGIWVMLAYFLVLGSLIILIHLMYGEVALKTPDFKRFPGFVNFHLGKWFGRFSLVSTVLGSFGVLLVYLIIGSQFLSSIFLPIFGGSKLLYVFIYFALASLIIYFGIKIVSKVELGVLVFLLSVLVLIFIKGFSQIKIDNLFIENIDFGIKDLFLPYGAIIFSLWGTGMIPEAEEMLNKNLFARQAGKKLIKKIIIIAILIPTAIYLFFIFLVLGISGSNVTESALAGLKSFLGNGLGSLGVLVGVATTFVGFITLGLTLKKMLIYDLKIKSFHSWVIVCFAPLILFLLGLNSFIGLISFIGGVLLGIDGILILLMYKKIRGKNLLIYPLSLIFIFGIIYELVYFFK
ncbi:MAG: aromatic amino acid transport family protein [Patescibacteria group bacterium]